MTHGLEGRCSIQLSYEGVVPGEGLEPSRLATSDFKSAVSAFPPSRLSIKLHYPSLRRSDMVSISLPSPIGEGREIEDQVSSTGWLLANQAGVILWAPFGVFTQSPS